MYSCSSYVLKCPPPSETRLPAFEDQDLVVQVPAVAVGTEVTYFSVWCRSNNVSSLQSKGLMG